jgi:prepilin-type N-terminal cleavage/methylation domain-containing protein
MFKPLRNPLTALMSKQLPGCPARRGCRTVPDQDGFTVTELAIGIAIISILAVVAVPNVQLLMM